MAQADSSSPIYERISPVAMPSGWEAQIQKRRHSANHRRLGVEGRSWLGSRWSWACLQLGLGSGLGLRLGCRWSRACLREEHHFDLGGVVIVVELPVETTDMDRDPSHLVCDVLVLRLANDLEAGALDAHHLERQRLGASDVAIAGILEDQSVVKAWPRHLHNTAKVSLSEYLVMTYLGQAPGGLQRQQPRHNSGH